LDENIQRGFTLVEVLIAILILGTVLTTIYASYTGTFRITRDMEDGDEIYDMARSTLERVVMDLASVKSYGGSFDFVLKRVTIRGNPVMSSLVFTSASHLDFEDTERGGGLASISYTIEEDKEDEGFILYRKDTPKENSNTDIAANEGFMLCNRLQSLSFKFYDASGREFETWDSKSADGLQKNKAPSAIYIDLEFVNRADKNHPYRFMTKILVPAASIKT
jgi:general secretion pathway protein J